MTFLSMSRMFIVQYYFTTPTEPCHRVGRQHTFSVTLESILTVLGGGGRVKVTSEQCYSNVKDEVMICLNHFESDLHDEITFGTHHMDMIPSTPSTSYTHSPEDKCIYILKSTFSQ